MISPKETADQMRKLGELFATVAPHIEDMDTLEQRKAVLEKRVSELEKIARESIVTRDKATADARRAAQDAMNAAEAHKQSVLAELQGKQKTVADTLVRMQAQAKEQADALGAKLGSLQLEIRDLTAQRDQLLVHVTKLKTSLQDSMAAL
jgi:chaperonin cofactor prefoldin